MAYNARVFRVLIASPSDVEEERELAVKTIQKWNDLNSSETQIVLLPLRWETHSSPEYRKRPQEIINEQIVDHCDFLVGIFWTRIGSPSGISPSGTIEEIERTADAGKPVMLYFSRAKADIDKIEIDQLKMLREFEAKTKINSLIKYYSDAVDFRDKFFTSLELQVRKIASDSIESDQDIDENNKQHIIFQFAEPYSAQPIGDESSVETINFSEDISEKIPDYELPTGENENVKSTTFADMILSKTTVASTTNPNYLRELYSTHAINSFIRPIRFLFKNNGKFGLRDFFAELQFESEAEFYLLDRNPVSMSYPSKTRFQGSSLLTSNFSPTMPQYSLPTPSKLWSASVDVGALQPKRQISPNVLFWIGARESCSIKIKSTIYADVLPQPIVLDRKLTVNVSQPDNTQDIDSILQFISQSMAGRV